MCIKMATKAKELSHTIISIIKCWTSAERLVVNLDRVHEAVHRYHALKNTPSL